MSNTISGDDAKILYSTSNIVYEYLPSSTRYSFGVQCKSKEYQPANQPYTFDAKISKKADLTIDFLEPIGFELPDPCYLIVGVVFANNLTWLRKGRFQHLNQSISISPSEIETRSIQFSALGAIDSFTIPTLNYDLVWQTIDPNQSTVTWLWQTI